MAYAALVSLAETVDQVLNDVEYRISVHGKQQIRSIHEHMVHFLEFLEEDFPEKANSLEGLIRDVAHEAEDIIAHFMWEQSEICYSLIKSAVGSSKFKSEHNQRRKYKHRLYDFHELKKVTDEIELIAERIDLITGEDLYIKDRFRIKDKSLGCNSSASSSPRLAPTLHKDAMVGLDDDLTEIKSRLCGNSSKLQVIPIFGMGGNGKTTLARNAYDDPLIMGHFHFLAWIAVSQDYSPQEILSGLLASLGEVNKERSGQNKESVEEKVYKSLKGRRYLIVMDDMWSTKVWDRVRNLFPDDANGSRIILTTRLLDVAAYPDHCGPPHEMQLMDADQSWKLLRKRCLYTKIVPRDWKTLERKLHEAVEDCPLQS